jgi:hypothetical protein
MITAMARTLRPFLGCVLLAFATTLHAQDIRADLKRAHTAWEHLDRTAFDVRYELYAFAGASKPAERMNGHVVRDGERFVSNFNGVLTVQNEQVMVTRNDEEKYVIVQKPVKEAPSPYRGIGPDSLLAWSKESRLLREDAQWRVYELVLDKPTEYTRAELHIDKATGAVLRLILDLRRTVDLDPADGHPKDHPRLVFTIEGLDTTSAPAPNLFSTTSTVRKEGKHWVLAASVKGHQLIEMLD